MIAGATLLLASGCQMAGTSKESNLLGDQMYQSYLDTSEVSKSENHSSDFALQPATIRNLIPTELDIMQVQSASFQEERDRRQPEIALSNFTLEELEGIALQNNPSIAEAAALVEAAQGNRVQVGLGPNPVLGYSGQQLGSSGQAEQQGVFIGKEFITGKKLGLNQQRASWKVQRAERELEAFRLRVLTDVRVRFYDVLIAQRRRELAGELVGISTQGVEAAQALFMGQEVSEADPLRAKVEADTALILLQTSVNQHVESWRLLTAVLGMPELTLQRLQGDLSEANVELSWQDTLHQVISESPEIAAAYADIEATRWAIQRAYAENIPNVEVQAVIQDDRGTGSTNGNLQVSLPIPFWNRNQGGIRQAHYEAIAAERAVERLTLDLQARLASAFQRYESARNQVDKYSQKDGILDNASRTLELIRIGYRADEYNVLDLLNVQRTYFQANITYLDAQRELWVSVMQIRGLLLTDSLSK
ncbi:MAG: hypothetical protein COA78_05515 [Blastopirellula sp.]|nr:MAG: hypothetical protein COA78_05515 [Blastopirellula sp.]